MFTALENEIVRILQANLSQPNVSPELVPANDVVNGPITPPPPGKFPKVAFTADIFEILPMEDISPPQGVKAQIDDVFAQDGTAPLILSESPLEPLRSVEVEKIPGGERILLRERDDYTVDYLSGRVHLRRTPGGSVFIKYFTLQPLRVIISTRLRITCRLEVWAKSDPKVHSNVDTIATVAMGAIAANAPSIDGLLTQGEDVVDSGLPSLGTRRALFIFESLRPIGGTSPDQNSWQVNYLVDATMILVPTKEAVGLIRYLSGGVAWYEKLATFVLATQPPILERPVTIIQNVGSATAATLAGMGITTVVQLAQATPVGQTQIDNAIPKAQTIRKRSLEVVREIVQAMPEIADAAAFLALRLDDVDTADLTAVDIPTATANKILAALNDLMAQTSATDLALSDLFFIPE